MGGLHITIGACFLKRHITVCLNINAKCFHEIVLSTKQAAEKSLPPAVLLFIFIIGFVFTNVTSDVVYRIADKIENDFPYVINDEVTYRYKKGVCDGVSNK